MTDLISNERLAEMLSEVEIEFDNALSDAEADQNPQLAVDPVGEFDLIELRSILTEIQSRRQSPAGVRVKPLEWEDADEGMCTKWRSAALGGHYELVSFDKEPGFAVNFSWGRPLSYWFIQGEPNEWGQTEPKMFPTLEDAKAAAQADCDSRILSSLSVGPEGVEPVGEGQSNG